MLIYWVHARCGIQCADTNTMMSRPLVEHYICCAQEGTTQYERVCVLHRFDV